MKRFSMFIAFLLCLTLTGVYATWLYAGVKTDIADVEQIMQVAMEDYDFELYYFSPFRPGQPTPGLRFHIVSVCLNYLAVTEYQPFVHRLRLSASP